MGEVSTNPEVRYLLSTDSSVLEMVPAFVVYPRDEQDIRKTCRFAWQLAERGKGLPITPRGAGSDTTGAAIGSGALVMMPTHMNRILSLDAKKRQVIVEAGISYDKLQQALFTHDLFFPSYPAATYSTVGGGVANNVVGEKSFKYGDTGSNVQSVRVVLANGEIIETGPLNKKELSFKMGLSTFEGQIYRSLDALLEDNDDAIRRFAFASQAQHNAIGYQLSKIKTKDRFDLTQLFVGSQGTLGIITEATLKLTELNQDTTLVLISLQKISDFNHILMPILKLKPSLFEMINKEVVDEVAKASPKLLVGNLPSENAELHLIVEFDDEKEATRKQSMKTLIKIIESVGGDYIGSGKYEDKLKIHKVRESIATLFVPHQGQKTALPVAEDLALPLDKLVDFLKAAPAAFAQSRLPAAMWGHVGSGIIRVYPSLDLSEVSDRQKFFKLSETLYNLATSLGGSVTAAAGEGRVRAPYVRQLYGEELYKLTAGVKAIFDPHNILNPGIKTASIDDVKGLMRSKYSLAHRHEHRPRS